MSFRTLQANDNHPSALSSLRNNKRNEILNKKRAEIQDLRMETLVEQIPIKTLIERVKKEEFYDQSSNVFVRLRQAVNESEESNAEICESGVMENIMRMMELFMTDQSLLGNVLDFINDYISVPDREYTVDVVQSGFTTFLPRLLSMMGRIRSKCIIIMSNITSEYTNTPLENVFPSLDMVDLLSQCISSKTNNSNEVWFISNILSNVKLSTKSINAYLQLVFKLLRESNDGDTVRECIITLRKCLSFRYIESNVNVFDSLIVTADVCKLVLSHSNDSIATLQCVLDYYTVVTYKDTMDLFLSLDLFGTFSCFLYSYSDNEQVARAVMDCISNEAATTNTQVMLAIIKEGFIDYAVRGVGDLSYSALNRRAMAYIIFNSLYWKDTNDSIDQFIFKQVSFDDYIKAVITGVTSADADNKQVAFGLLCIKIALENDPALQYFDQFIVYGFDSVLEYILNTNTDDTVYRRAEVLMEMFVGDSDSLNDDNV